MKKLIILLLSIYACIINCEAQGTASYSIRVNDNQLQPMSNIPVTLIETTSKERISKSTDSQGKVTFELNSGREWAMNILQMKNCGYIEIPENGKSTGSRSITYDYKHYERKHRPLVDRNSLNIHTEDQTTLKSPKYSQAEAVVHLRILKEDKSSLSNFPVNLTCYKLEKTFLGKTDKTGVAYFKVPTMNEFEVDIDGVESFNYVDVEKTGQYTLEITYQPTNLKETEVNDTITQFIPKESKGTSSRVSLKMLVSQPGKNKLANEDVYLQMLKSNKVYRAKTNPQGEAYFLLPVKRKYMVHFRYQKDIDVLNYMDVQGISNAEIKFTYTPDPKLQFPERYFPTPQDLMVKEFFEFITKQFPEPANDDAMGLTLAWGNDSVNIQSKEAVLQVGFKAKATKGNADGPPINISLVVDKSGSMEGHDRIDALKIALLQYVSKLRKTDIVSLVVFDDQATVVVPAQPVGDGSYLKDMIEDIEAGGGTDIYKGMVDGYEQILKNFKPKGTNRLVLLTDGYGVTPVEEIVSKSKEYNSKGIELSAVGIGEGYNQAMLTLLATTGGGLLHFAGQAKDINAVFEKELSSVLNPCAKDVKVEITYNGQIIFKQLYGFPFEQKGHKVELKLNNIYSGLNTLALVKFDLNKPDVSIEKTPVIVRMQYFDLKKNKDVLLEEKAYLKWSTATGQFELIVEAQHKKLYAIAILNQSLKVMTEAFAAKDSQRARSAIQNSIDQIKKLYPQSKDEDVQKLVAEAERYAKTLTYIMANKVEK
ncbi:MAG: VWA domain-containing protein [Bacteroidota bacterium]